MSPQGAIYPQYNASRHVTNREGNLDEITHLSLDIGNFGAVLFGQETVVPTRDVVGGQGVDKGLHIVDQILTVDESVDRMCYRIKTETSWNIVPGRSVICVDPTIRRDETKALREHFPGCRIIKRDRGHAMFPVEAGIRQVQRGLMDALGNVRLTFAPKLRNQKLGVLDFLERYRRNEKTNEPIKDNLRDHVGDALRYMVAEVIPTDKPVARIL